jgi:hypothetical protein
MRGGQSLPGRPYEGPDKRPHMRFDILSLQTMMSSRIHPGASFPPGEEKRGRIDPSIHDVRFAANGRSRDGNVFSAIALRELDGGARRDRTDDLMLAKHALYQLSYGPSFKRPASAGSTPFPG